MSRRTQITNASKIEHTDDVDHFVQDKRIGKRAGKKKAERRNRHYVKDMLRHISTENDLMNNGHCE